jgi:hypothetical protein
MNPKILYVVILPQALVYGYSDVNDFTCGAGATLIFYQGWCFGNTSAGTVIHDSTPAGKVDCTLYADELRGGSTYSRVAENLDIVLADGQVDTVGYRFGWWNWRVRWHWDTGAMILAGISW